ncbi:MAG: hypothetical protein H7A01_08265 [Hahellaceae bacterium]|nr:hypothetical protein [Hahellaceae bacterium]MCP5211538.1 hypothetical protein [Hahellaceae bacterium]
MDSSSVRKRSLSALAFLLSSFLGLVVLANLVSRELHASSNNEITLPVQGVLKTVVKKDGIPEAKLIEVEQSLANQP